MPVILIKKMLLDSESLFENKIKKQSFYKSIFLNRRKSIFVFEWAALSSMSVICTSAGQEELWTCLHDVWCKIRRSLFRKTVPTC